MSQPNPAIESSEQSQDPKPRQWPDWSDDKLREMAAAEDGCTVGVGSADAVMEQIFGKPQAPQRPAIERIPQFHRTLISLSFVQAGDFKRYADAYDSLRAGLEAQFSAALEREKEKDAKLIRLGELVDEACREGIESEAELTRVKDERDRMREALEKIIDYAPMRSTYANIASAALTPPPAKEKS